MLRLKKIALVLPIGISFTFAACTRNTEFNPENKATQKQPPASDTDGALQDGKQINTDAPIRDGDKIVATPTSEPIAGPIVPEIVKPKPEVVAPPVIQSSGTLNFKAVLFLNMEHEAHATDHGTYAVLKSPSGSLIAAGPVTLESATSGKNLGGMGYPVTQLKVNLEKLSKDSQTSGEGSLSICRIADKTSYACAADAKAVDRERPVAWLNESVKYAISGDTVTINNEAGMIGNGPGIAGGLSFAHPMAMAALGAETNMYADCSSPVVLDLNGNGKLDLISLADPKHKIKFDLMGAGTKKRVGWVSSEDGLLALDVNNDGKIDSGTELFGEYSHETKVSKELKVRNFENGFLALAQYDSNKDEKIDQKDSIYSKLLVWTDTNSNGVSEKSELKSLTEANVGAVSLVSTSTFTGTGYQMEAGNELRYLGSYKTLNGSVRLAADVWFMQEMIGMASTH